MSARIVLAHGVGRVYEAPLPVWLYALGAAATVLASFGLRALVPLPAAAAAPRRFAGPATARAVTALLRGAGLAGLGLALVAGAAVRSQGFTTATLLLWVGLIVGMTALSALLDGAWPAADPWAALERAYRIEGGEVRRLEAPWWLGAVLVYLLFWFELVAGVGFKDFWVVAVLVLYSLFALSLRAPLGEDAWARTDPLSLLFGFAGRCAPLQLRADGIYLRGSINGIDREGPMPRALFAALFVVLASTTLDNVRETVGWTSFKRAAGVAALPPALVDSLALAAFAPLFLAPFLVSVRLAQRWVGRRLPFFDLARRFGWSLVPIAVAYVLAHNAPLLFTGLPALLRALSDPFALGWNLFGTAGLALGWVPSPAFVWFSEIALIVGGHVLGVLGAHRAAARLAASRVHAVRSQYALTALMALFTVTTLWLLAQPLVA